MQTKPDEHSLPKGWYWGKLIDVCEITGGSSAPQGSEPFDGGTIPFVRMRDLGRYHFTSNLNKTDDKLTESAVQKYRMKIFEPGCILFPRSGSVALNHRAILGTRACIVSHIGVLHKFSNTINAQFLYCYLLTYDMTRLAKKTTGIDSIAFSDVAEIKVPIPPLDEQRRIASRLNEQLAAVELARKAAEEQLQAAWQLPSAFLREVFESLFTKDTRKRKLGDFVISYRNGFGRRPTGSGDGGVIVLRLADVTGGKINLETPRRGVMTDEELETYSVKNGDLLFVRVNGSKDLVGRCAIVQDLPEVVSFNDHLIRVRLNDEVLPEYVKLVTDTHEVRNFIVEMASTSAGQLTINQEMLSSLEIPIFSLSEQQNLIHEYKEEITESDSLIKILESQLAEINRLPAYLLREAFAGGI